MFYSRFKVFIFNLVFILLSSIIFVNSACVTTPSHLEVSSGSKNLGEFQVTDEIFVNGNLGSNPLKIDFIFLNNEPNCFNAKEDLNFKLFSTAIETPANSFSTINNSGEYVSTFSVIRDSNLKIINSFVSSYRIINSENQESSGSILLSADTDVPIFQTFAIQPSNPLISSNDEIQINYLLSDSGVGLDLITITGTRNTLIPFKSKNNTFEGEIKEFLDDTTTFTITARDKLGKSSSRTVSFVVDNQAPQITNVEKNYAFDLNRRVSFDIIIEDVSFLYLNDVPRVIGDFSSINPSFSNYLGNCLRNTNSSYLCSFDNIEITQISSTQNVLIEFNLTDSLENSRIQNFQEEVFVDLTEPEIIDFFLENSLGVRNVFSSSDSKVKVHLKFRDSSIEQGEPRIFTSFDLISFNSQECIYSGNTGTCVFELGNLSAIYQGVDKRDSIFEVIIVDFYANQAKDTFTAQLDNNFPILTTIEVIETETIKDNILKSGEKINFRVFIEDDNLIDGGDYFIKGDFSNVDFREGKDSVNGLCSSFNDNILQCDFNSIILENGYMKRNVTFEISDIAGNSIKKNKELEIFQISDEVFSSYNVDLLEILNPLNRNQMQRGGGVAWFEGELELVGDQDISIISYQITRCSEEELDPLLVIDYELFPQEVVVNTGQEDIEKFAMKVELKDHQNFNDLNNKKMNCKLSVLKKDLDTIYAPEIVNLELEFNFYDVPRGDLLEANAQRILDMYKDIDSLGSWFDSTYEIYSMLNGICSAVSTAGGMMSAVGNVVYGIQWLITVGSGGNFLADQMAGNIGKAAYRPQEILGSSLFGEKSFIKKSCDWVTCRNGAHLTGLISGAYGDGEEGLSQIPGLSDLVNGFNSLCQEGAVELFSQDGSLSKSLEEIGS